MTVTAIVGDLQNQRRKLVPGGPGCEVDSSTCTRRHVLGTCVPDFDSDPRSFEEKLSCSIDHGGEARKRASCEGLPGHTSCQ